MSVTLTIRNNHEYCSKTDKRQIEDYICECAASNANIPKKDCYECKGTGRVHFEFDMYEINVCHGTLITIGSIIGLNEFEDYSGEIDPFTFLTEMQGIGIEQFVDDFCIRRHCTPEYGIVIWEHLEELCKEAVKRSEKLIWS